MADTIDTLPAAIDHLTPVELTEKQKEQWGDSMSMFAWTAPGFRHLWYRMLVNNDHGYFALMTKDIPTAATDARNIMVNPDWFFGLELPERTFVAAHEVVHNVFGDVELLYRCQTSKTVPQHDGSTLPFEMDVMQKAMDLRINALLTESKIGKMPMKNGKQEGHLDLKLGAANDSVLDVYKRCYKKKKEDEGEGGDSGPNPGGFDQVLPPGKSTGQNPSQAATQRNPGQWAIEIAAAQTMEQIKSQGRMAGALQRMFKDILEPEIPWTDMIKGEFARKVGSGSYNWRKPDRRFITRDLYMPSKSGHGAGWVVIWGDTSGSIGQSELERYIGELGGIVEDCHPKRLTVIWCDNVIQHVDEVEDAGDLLRIKQRGVGGGGGTSCDPVFKWIRDNSYEPPDMFVGFTDGYVTFPKNEPSYPVIWASTTDTVYPWGETVRIKQ